MKQPYIGAIVHWCEWAVGEDCTPAMIMVLSGTEKHRVDLGIFIESSNAVTGSSWRYVLEGVDDVPYSEKAADNTWHWPEEAAP